MKKILYGAALMAVFVGFVMFVVSCGPTPSSPSSSGGSATATPTSTPFYSGGPAILINSGIAQPYGIVFDSFSASGLWFVVNLSLGKLYNYSTTGVLGSSSQYYTGTSSYNYPLLVSADPSGNLYVGDYGNNQIDILTSAGAYVKSLTGITKPWGIAFNSAGTTMYVSEGTTPATFLTYTVTAATYTYTSVGNSFPTSGTYDPNRAGLAVDASGNVYANDLNNGEILKYGPTGAGAVTFAPPPGGTYTPWGIALDSSGNLFATEQITGSSNYVEEYTSAGNAAVSIGGFGSSSSLTGITVDGSGNLYVSDNGNQYIWKVSK